MSKFSNNFHKVTFIKHWTENLFSFRIQRPQSFKFRSGEFVMIGLPNQVSDSLKSFYETNRIIKCKVLGNKLKYKYKYPDYSKALLNLTKKLIKNK